MKKSVLLIALLFFASIKLFPQNVEIKSLKAYSGGDQTSFPVIVKRGNGADRLTIDCDIKSRFSPKLAVVFRFCDRNWVPYRNIFMMDPNKTIDRNMSYDVLPQTVKEADYHFRGSYPNSDGITFPYSGKWRFYITDSYDTTIVYGTGKFYVVSGEMNVSENLKREKLEGGGYFPTDLAKVFSITTDFNLPDKLTPAFVDRIEIISNQEIDYPVIVDRNGNSNTRAYYWDGSRKFSFVARDILPGNEYREADLRNTDKFAGPNVNAHLFGLEYSRFFTLGSPDLNGASILDDYNDVYSTYLNVTFSIRPPNEVAGGIYLVGAFNNWKVSPDYKLNDNYGVYSITVPLKRGIYDYQYVIGSEFSGKIINLDWQTLEGNNWDTSNIYHIFVYYKDPDFGGYDRIIGYQQIKSN